MSYYNTQVAKLVAVITQYVFARVLTSKEFWIIVNVLSILAFLIFVSFLLVVRKKQRSSASASLYRTTVGKKETCDQVIKIKEHETVSQSNQALYRGQNQDEKPVAASSPWQRESTAYIELDSYSDNPLDVMASTSTKSQSLTGGNTHDGTFQPQYSNVTDPNQEVLTCNTVAEVRSGQEDGDVTISITLKGSEVRQNDLQIRRTESYRAQDVSIPMGGYKNASAVSCPWSADMPRKVVNQSQALDADAGYICMDKQKETTYKIMGSQK